MMNMMEYIRRTGFNSCPVRSSKFGMPCRRGTSSPGGGPIAGIASLRSLKNVHFILFSYRNDIWKHMDFGIGC